MFYGPTSCFLRFFSANACFHSSGIENSKTAGIEKICRGKSCLDPDTKIIKSCAACPSGGKPLKGFFLGIVKGQLEITEQNPDDYLWHSFWFLIHKTDRVVVGSADFKGLPDAKQEVETGYGLGKEFEHQGYMTEAVQALCKWALEQKNVSHIIAETDLDGFASQRILQRCRFTETKRQKTV